MTKKKFPERQTRQAAYDDVMRQRPAANDLDKIEQRENSEQGSLF